MTDRLSSPAGGGSSGDPGSPGSSGADRATRRGPGPSLSRGARIGALGALVAAGVALLVTRPAAQAPEPTAQPVTQAPAEGPAAPPVGSAPRAVAPPVGGAPPPAVRAGTLEDEEDDEPEEAGPEQAHVYEPAESPASGELQLDVKLAPRAPLSAEPFVPREIVLEATPAPRAPVTAEPLVPVVVELRVEPAAPRR